VTSVDAILVFVAAAELVLAGKLLYERGVGARLTAAPERRGRPVNGPLQVVARLSDTCSSCRWIVPQLNAVRERAAHADADGVVFVAELVGDEARFLEETGLSWPTRTWSRRDGARAERLPNVVVLDREGAEVTRLETEELHELGEVVAELADLHVPTVAEVGRNEVADELSRVTQVLSLRGYLDGPIAWTVRADQHAGTLRVGAGTRSGIAVTPHAGHALRCAATFDPALAIVRRELTIYGDARLAARTLVDMPLGCVLADQLGDDVPVRDLAGEVPNIPLEAVAADVAAATCLRLSSPLARKASLRAMWDRGRSAAEPEADRIFAVYAALVEPWPC